MFEPTIFFDEEENCHADVSDETLRRIAQMLGAKEKDKLLISRNTVTLIEAR